MVGTQPGVVFFLISSGGVSPLLIAEQEKKKRSTSPRVLKERARPQSASSLRSEPPDGVRGDSLGSNATKKTKAWSEAKLPVLQE